MDDSRTRRGAIRAASALAVAATGVVAGCLTDDPDATEEDPEPTTGTGTRTTTGGGTGTPTPAETTRTAGTDGNDGGRDPGAEFDGPDYARLLPAPAALPEHDEEDHFTFRSYDVERVVENRDRIGDETYARATEYFGGESVLPAADDMKRVLFVGGIERAAGAFVGDIGGEAYRDRVERNTDERVEHDGKTIYRLDGQSFVLGDGVAVLSGYQKATDRITAVLDAANGETERLTAAVDAADRLVEELGDGVTVEGWVSPPASRLPEGYDPGGVVAIGEAIRFEAERVAVDQVVVYDGGPPTPDALQAAASASPTSIARVDDRSVSVSGQVATVSGTVSPADLGYSTFGFGVGLGEDGPARRLAPWRAFEFDAGGEGVTVVYRGDVSFTPDVTGAAGSCDEGGLGVLVDGDPATCFPVRNHRRNSDRIWAGDSVTVDAGAGSEVRVVWTPPGGGRTRTLALFRVPD